MSERWTVTALDEVGGLAAEGRSTWHLIRTSLGIEGFGINAWTATEDGQTLIPEHNELGEGAAGHEELYLVVRGSASFAIDGEQVDAPAGTLVFVRDPAVRRAATGDAGTTVVAIGGKPGQAFAQSGWERASEALVHWNSGDWDRAIDVLGKQLSETPADANVLYNLACAEAQAGHTDDALSHLARAIELSPASLDHAQDDPDLASLRDDPRFPRPAEA